jgi:hypothetical protein
MSVPEQGSQEEKALDQALVNAVIDQIRNDFSNEDTTALDELLGNNVERENLIQYLPESQHKNFVFDNSEM